MVVDWIHDMGRRWPKWPSCLPRYHVQGNSKAAEKFAKEGTAHWLAVKIERYSEFECLQNPFLRQYEGRRRKRHLRPAFNQWNKTSTARTIKKERYKNQLLRERIELQYVNQLSESWLLTTQIVFEKGIIFFLIQLDFIVSISPIEFSFQIQSL